MGLLGARMVIVLKGGSSGAGACAGASGPL